jgi:hypothetical protein
MSRLLSWASVAILAGFGSAALLSAQEVPPKVEEKKPAEGAPANVKYVPPANIYLDTAKTLRLTGLLDNLYVLNELNVSDDVYAALKDVKQQERVASRSLSDELSKENNASRNLPLAERMERTRIFFPAYKARRDAVMEGLAFQRFNLLSAAQMERLVQVDFQDQGLDAYLADDVIKGLKLTTEERKKLDEIYDTYLAKIKPLLHLGLYTEAKAVRSTRPEVVALIKERAAKTDELLGKERAEKLAELRGKAFDVSRLEATLGGLPIREPTIPPASARLLDLLQYDAVRKDLQLSPEEEAAIAAAKTTAEKTGSVLEGIAKEQISGMGLTEVQRALRTQEITSDYQRNVGQIRQNYQAELGKIIKESHLKRLEQIDLQKSWRSLRPFSVLFGVPNKLDLTSDQLTKMRAIEADNRQKTAGLNGFAGFGASLEEIKQRNELRKELKKQEETQLLEVLNPEQRQKLKELQGPPFDVSIFDSLSQLSIPPENASGRDPLEAKFDQSVIDYVSDTLLREQDTNGDGSLDKSEWIKGKWSMANPPENSDLNKDGKLSREELCIRISKSRGIPIRGEQPQPVPGSSK